MTDVKGVSGLLDTKHAARGDSSKADKKAPSRAVYMPASIKEFIDAFNMVGEEKKLSAKDLERVHDGIFNPFRRTLAVELDAKPSPVRRSMPVSNQAVTTLMGLMADKFPNAFRIVDLAHNGVDDKTMQDIMALLIRSRSIIELNLSGNCIGRTGCNTITQTLTTLNGAYLTSLSLRNNPIGDDAIRNLAKFLRTNPPLRVLDIGNVEAGTIALIHIASSLQENTNLTDLSIDRPLKADSNDEETSVHLAKAFRCNKSLKRLSMGKHRMRAHGTMWMMEYILKWNKGLTALDLVSNQVCSCGAEYISKVLTDKDCNLSELSLNSNRLTNEGAISLADALTSNNSLEILDLSYTDLTDDGLVALANAVGSNVTLRTLRLSGNTFGSRAKKAWQRLLGWPVKEEDGGHFLDVESLDFIPLIAPFP